MKKYIIINLNQSESKETQQERVNEQIRWALFSVFLILFLGANIRIWMISSGYDRIIVQKEQEIEEVSAAMRALRRRNAKSAYAKKTIAKYGQAAKMGIPASQVNQRRNTVTRTK